MESCFYHALSAVSEYTKEIFKENVVIDINITISSENRSYMKANASKEKYASCDISVAGYKYKNVGIRPKGNSTLQSLAKMDTEKRFSFKVKFNEYVKGQKLLGLEKLVLNCGYQDKTFYFRGYRPKHLFSVIMALTLNMPFISPRELI